MSLARSVDEALRRMHEVGGTDKGTIGEEAVLKVCEELYQSNGGILIHSFTYKTDQSQAGNVKRGDQGNLYIENLGSTTEIDVLFATPRRVFAIEVKAYKAKEIILDDASISGCFKTDKSPVHQNEMHCRHLYQAISEALPDGNPDYIIPIVVFVDQCKIIDRRSPEQKSYIKVTVLKQLYNVLKEMDTPLEYLMDMHVLERRLNAAKTSCEKYLPYRSR